MYLRVLRTPYANRLINGAYNYSGQGRFPIYGNPDLKEETSLNYEIAAIYNNDLFYVSATGFLTNFKDKISTQRYDKNNMIQELVLVMLIDVLERSIMVRLSTKV